MSIVGRMAAKADDISDLKDRDRGGEIDTIPRLGRQCPERPA